MNKAVVLEIKEEYAAVLTDEGFVQKIRNENYAVGQEIELTAAETADTGVKKTGKNTGKTMHRWYRAAAAAAAVFVLSGSGLYYASQNVLAYSTVTVTTEEASMELTLNRKDEVVAVRALDEKSEETASEMEISVRKRSSLSDTLKKITDGHEQAEISVTSRNDERKEKLQNEVKEMIPPVQQEILPAAEAPAEIPAEAPAGTGRPEDMAAPAEPHMPEDMAAPAEPHMPEDMATPAEPYMPEDAIAPAIPAGPEEEAGQPETETPAAPVADGKEFPEGRKMEPQEAGEVSPNQGMPPDQGMPPGGGAFPPP